MHECVIADCGQRLTHHFWLCADHEAIYGPEHRDWPEWLRDLVNAHRRERYAEEERADYEFLYGLDPESIGLPHNEPQFDEDGHRHSNGGPMTSCWRLG